MRKRVCSQAKFNWSAEISMTRARLLRESLCFTMIRLLRLARWTRLRWHIGKQARRRKQIDCRTSYASDTRITRGVEAASLFRAALLVLPGRCEDASHSKALRAKIHR